MASWSMGLSSLGPQWRLLSTPGLRESDLRVPRMSSPSHACSLVYVPRTVAKALYAKIGGKERGTTGEYVVPCTSTFGSLALQFGGKVYPISLPDLFLGFAEAGNKQDCILGIFGVDQRDAAGNSVAIIGALFLKVSCGTRCGE